MCSNESNEQLSSRHRSLANLTATRVPVAFIDCEAPMDHRSPLQHMLRNLLPSRGQRDTAHDAPDFVDTEPVDARAAAAQAAHRAASAQRRPVAWAESALDLAKGSDVTELPADAAADLMDQFFAKSGKKAA